ncbi:HtrA protease/chaperone protein [hydrothermal vent metagenome]|uniref:HtrA protease/chaperone protein n=1 Tax=hydrothermal vent metagenome TaxID=652676 RepID=A0A3B0UMD0_9ZZZZ
MNFQTRIKWLWLPFFIVLTMLLAACGGAETVVTQTINTLSNETDVETAVLAEEDPVAEAVVETVEETAVEPTTTPLTQPANDPLADLFAQEQAYVSVYEQVNPAVVNINTGGGQGSGFLFDNNGHIVTNNHVVEGSSNVTVTFDDGNQLPARIVGTDPASDLAVLQVDASQINITPVRLADSDALRVGQIVIAIGSPFGLQSSMTTGIVSALDRLFPGAVGPNGTSFQIPDIIQTDAAINPGNSGGPLLNLRGEVIGVNTAIESPVRGSSGIGYAVPANIVSNIVPQIIANGRVETPWLGISGNALTEDTAVQLGLPATQKGVLVSETISGGAAATAGLRGGNSPDVIVGIDDTVVTEIDDLLGYLVQHTVVGQTVTLQILRDGQLQTATLTLLARPASG